MRGSELGEEEYVRIGASVSRSRAAMYLETKQGLGKAATGRGRVLEHSREEQVQNKIRTLGQSAPGQLDWLVDRVHGNARKYVVDPDFSQVETSLQLPGLARPILLRRSNYHAVLDALREEAGAEWSEMLVIGDIFELDLSLPLAMGASVCLLVNPFTPGYEKNFLEKHPRGHVIHDLAEIIALAAS